MITQPGMYKKIGSQKKVTSKYADKLIEEGAVTNDAFKVLNLDLNAIFPVILHIFVGK